MHNGKIASKRSPTNRLQQLSHAEFSRFCARLTPKKRRDVENELNFPRIMPTRAGAGRGLLFLVALWNVAFMTWPATRCFSWKSYKLYGTLRSHLALTSEWWRNCLLKRIGNGSWKSAIFAVLDRRARRKVNCTCIAEARGDWST